MKTFSFIASILAFAATLYFMVTDFPELTDLDGIIYFSLLAILLLICATGIIINWPHISGRISKTLRKRHKTAIH